MGILNVTPDSFSDGGRHANVSSALRHAHDLVQQGVDIIDVGGESTRPGSPAVSLALERERVIPVIRELVKLQVPISVDTYKPEIMREVLDLGADVINDIWALRQPAAMQVVAAHPLCGVCLMHMHRDPQTMQTMPMQGDVVEQVLALLQQQADLLDALGVARDRLVLDAGIGFGKTVEQNFALLARQQELLALGRPWVAGWSRKSSLGAVTGCPVEDRLAPSVAAAVLAADRGAKVLRVHDVAATISALKVWKAMRNTQNKDQGNINNSGGQP